MNFSQIKNVLGGVLENVSEKGKGYLENVSEKGKEYLETVSEKGKGVVDAAKDKTRTAGRVARLSMELNTEKGVLEDTFTELGKVYYEECAGSAMGIFAQLCDEITAVNARIEAMEAELAELKETLVPARASEEDFEDVVAQDECCCGCECECSDDITVEIVEDECCCCAEEVPVESGCDCAEEAACECEEPCKCECAEEAVAEKAVAEEAPAAEAAVEEVVIEENEPVADEEDFAE